MLKLLASGHTISGLQGAYGDERDAPENTAFTLQVNLSLPATLLKLQPKAPQSIADWLSGQMESHGIDGHAINRTSQLSSSEPGNTRIDFVWTKHADALPSIVGLIVGIGSGLLVGGIPGIVVGAVFAAGVYLTTEALLALWKFSVGVVKAVINAPLWVKVLVVGGVVVIVGFAAIAHLEAMTEPHHERRPRPRLTSPAG